MERDLNNGVAEAIIHKYTRDVHPNDREDVRQNIRLRWTQRRGKYAADRMGMGLLVAITLGEVRRIRCGRRLGCLHKPLHADGSRSVQPLDQIPSREQASPEMASCQDAIRRLYEIASRRERQIFDALLASHMDMEAAAKRDRRSYATFCRRFLRLKKKYRNRMSDFI